MSRPLATACKRFIVSARDIFHSGKRRAEQTAEVLGQALGLRPLAAAGLDPLDLVKPVAAECEDPPAVAFQRGGMVCLKKRGPGEWTLLWTLFPRQPR